MSTRSRAVFISTSLEDTNALARRMANAITAPAVLLLEGDIGAGKSAFARAFIRAAGVTEQDIPSPTFTLVQTYETSEQEIWHSDLYRLTHTDEVEELGLLAAFDTAICLVEWPEKLGEDTPENALHIAFSPKGDENSREITLSSAHPRWAKLLEQTA